MTAQIATHKALKKFRDKKERNAAENPSPFVHETNVIIGSLLLLLFLFLLRKTLLINHVGSFPVTRVSLKKYANTYTDEKFKKTILVSKATFNFILGHIPHDLQHDTVTEDPIPPALRLAMCLYCLAMGVAPKCHPSLHPSPQWAAKHVCKYKQTQCACSGKVIFPRYH